MHIRKNASEWTSAPWALPWFMYDVKNNQLITSKIIPGDIKDTKAIVITETPIPGLNYQPVLQVGGGNRKLSFTLPLIRRTPVTGNILILQQFMMLRNQSKGLFNFGYGKFSSYPKVLYSWGTGSIPLIYFVTKCDATHKEGWINAAGQPQYSEIEIELVLDEEDPLYKGEEVYRQVSMLLGEAEQAIEGVIDALGGRPY